MSQALQLVVVALLVLAAGAYAVWRLGPSSLRRRLGGDRDAAGDSCSRCQASGSVPNSKVLK